MISWQRCRTRWQMRNGRGLVCRVGVRSRRAACMNQNVCYRSAPWCARNDVLLPSACLAICFSSCQSFGCTYKHSRVSTLLCPLDDERFQGVRLGRVGEKQMAALSVCRFTRSHSLSVDGYAPYLRPIALHLFRTHSPHPPTQVMRDTDTVRVRLEVMHGDRY